MGFRFFVFKGTACAHDNRSFLVLQRAQPSTSGTGLFFAQLVGLLLRRHLQSSCQQAMNGCQGDVFHLVQINVQSGAFLAPILPHNDFPPAFRQFFNALEIFLLQFLCSHVGSLQ
jgi:hypothetical protein